jgi:hypothetical protein
MVSHRHATGGGPGKLHVSPTTKPSQDPKLCGSSAGQLLDVVDAPLPPPVVSVLPHPPGSMSTKAARIETKSLRRSTPTSYAVLASSVRTRAAPAATRATTIDSERR